MTRRITETSLMGALSVILYALAQTPALGLPLLLVCPLPTVMVCIRQGPVAGALCALVASVLTAMLLTPIHGYLFLLPFGLLGIVAGALYHRDEEPVTHLAVATGVVSVAIYFEVVFLDAALGFGESLELMTRAAALQVGGWAGWAHGRLAALVWARVGVIDVFVAPILWLLDPARVMGLVVISFHTPLFLCGLFSLAVTYANQVASFLVGARVGMPVPPPPELRHMRLPSWTLVVLAATLAAYKLAGGAGGGRVASIAINLTWAVLALLYVGGIGRAARLLDSRGASRRVRLACAMGTLLLFPLTVVLGVLDAAGLGRGRASDVDAGELAGFGSRPARGDAARRRG